MKKIIPLTLALLLVPAFNANAADMAKNSNEENKNEMVEQVKKAETKLVELYEVSGVNEQTVTLKFVENLNKDMDPSYSGLEFNVAREKFAEKDIKVGDRYKITHDDIILPSNPGQFGKIYSLEKVVIKESNDKKVEEEKITEKYQVEEVNEGGYIITKEGNSLDRYMVSKKEVNNMDLKVGDKIEITHDDIILTSEPAQFGKIFDVKKLEEKPSKDEMNKATKLTKTYQVEEVSEGGYIISEEKNSSDKYILSKKDASNMDLKVGDKIEITHDDIILTSDPGQFGKIFDVKKVEEAKKLEVKKETKISKKYLVEEVNESGYIVSSEDNKEEKYMLSKKEAKNMDLKVGDKIEITHDDIVLTSEPAQFGKIFDVKKVEEAKKEEVKEERIKENFIIEKIEEDGFIIAEIGNADNKYMISKEDAKNMDLKVGDRIEIIHNGLSTRSYPAQFMKIFKISKFDQGEKAPSKDNKKGNNSSKNINQKQMNTSKQKDKNAATNPKTGVLSSIGLVSLTAIAGALIKKTK